MTEQDLRKKTRHAVCAAINDDIAGGETLCKEVFEQCKTNDDLAVVLDELREIKNVIAKRGVIDGGD